MEIYSQEEMTHLVTKLLKDLNTKNRWVVVESDGVTVNIYKRPENVNLNNSTFKPFIKFKIVELNGEEVK